MPRTPKFDPIRPSRNRIASVDLPAQGRQGDPPPWPLPDPPSAAETQAWADLWATPQAVAWERLGWTRTVGRYCRMMVAAEAPGAKAALLAQVTALEDRLGLTPKSMRLLLWRVVADEVTERRQVRGARGRIRAVTE